MVLTPPTCCLPPTLSKHQLKARSGTRALLGCGVVGTCTAQPVPSPRISQLGGTTKTHRPKIALT